MRLLDGQRLDALIGHESFGVSEAGENVFPFHPGIAGDDGCRVVARLEHSENVLDGEPMAANDRLAAEDAGVHGDSREQVFFSHNSGILADFGPQTVSTIIAVASPPPMQIEAMPRFFPVSRRA